MNSKEAMKAMVKGSGKAAYRISQEMGRTNSFVGATMKKSNNIRFATLSLLADACGYETELVNRKTGEVIRIK